MALILAAVATCAATEPAHFSPVDSDWSILPVPTRLVLDEPNLRAMINSPMVSPRETGSPCLRD